MKRKKNEKLFEQQVKKFLEDVGVYHVGTPAEEMSVKPCGYWVKRWGGGKYIPAGLPDMQVSICGLSLDVELKAENGRLSELQVQKIRQMQEAGCLALALRPSQFQEFKDLVWAIKYEGVRDAGKLLEDWLL